MRDEERAKRVLKLHSFAEFESAIHAGGKNPKRNLEFACRMFYRQQADGRGVRKHNYNLEMVNDLSTRAQKPSVRVA